MASENVELSLLERNDENLTNEGTANTSIETYEDFSAEREKDPLGPGTRLGYDTIPDGGEGGFGVPGGAPHKPFYKKPVDVNVMKRNMSIAKGFMDISLLTANANQMRNLIVHGDTSSAIYYIIFTLLVISLALQITTGILLIVKERFDLNLEEDHKSAEHYNNIVVLFVFFTLLINVFVSSFGIDVMLHKEFSPLPPTKDQFSQHPPQIPGQTDPPFIFGGKDPFLESTNI